MDGEGTTHPAAARTRRSRNLALALARALAGALVSLGALGGGAAPALAQPKASPPAVRGGGGLPASLPETLEVARLAPADARRAFVFDVALPHIVDGKVHVIDGNNMRYLGLLPSGYAGQTLLSPDRTEIYVATTYYTRLSRGERADVVDVYDAATLAFKEEIRIPPTRAQALNYRGLLQATPDGRFLFVQNATPATSVTVVDLKARKAVDEIPLPGCWAIYPARSRSDRFSTMCGDGTFVTVTLDAAGKAAGQRRSAVIFDADRDPLFVSGDQAGDAWYFVSFQGVVHAVDVAGDEARRTGTWPLVSAAERRAGWRPGGYQVLALHEPSRRLYVAMHSKGEEGSHKRPAEQVWVMDLASMKRTARAPASNAIALAVSRDDRPLVFVLDGVKNALVTLDGATLRPRARLDGLTESAVQLELH